MENQSEEKTNRMAIYGECAAGSRRYAERDRSTAVDDLHAFGSLYPLRCKPCTGRPFPMLFLVPS